MQRYLTHDNGGRPFMVMIDKRTHSFEVFQYQYMDDAKEKQMLTCVRDAYKPAQCGEFWSKQVIQKTAFSRVFVGKSSKSRARQLNMRAAKGMAYYTGAEFDGNSILFQLRDAGSAINTKYMFIGDCIATFATRSPIKQFVSMIGNNDVPYPFAIDEDGVYYVFSHISENQLIKLSAKEALQSPEAKRSGDPYLDWVWNDWSSSRLKRHSASRFKVVVKRS